MTKRKYQDPHYQQELAKYGNPIPSRELILSVIRENNAPMNREEILTALSIRNEEKMEAMRRRLRAMENDGQLVFTKRKRYALPEKLDLVKGLVIGHQEGYGFLQVEGKKEDLFIPNHQMQRVMHGDFVLAQPTNLDHRGRREVRIVRVLESRKKQIVGRFFLENGFGYVVPDDNRIGRDILVPNEHRNGARMGQVVVVELQQRSAAFNQPIGVITEILGDSMAKGMEVEIALRNHDIPHQFPSAVEKYVKKFTEEVPEDAKKGRVDLRDLPLVTIDGEDARDFDDAVYCEKQSKGWKLWVAIADVSYYVRLHSALDNEAHNRGNSVYFPNRVVPMLPEILSNGLCSLNPQVDRLCMVCEMHISAKGKLTSYRFYEAVMNSHARLTYTKVAKILEGDRELRERYYALVPHLEELYHLYQALLSGRHQRGAIDFETIESKFIFNAMGRIERIEPVIRNDAHKIIEECMILANIAAANFMEKHNEPALYRIHATPSEEKLTSFRAFLSEFGLTLEGGLKPTTKDYAELLEKVKARPDHELIQTMLLRSLSQAVYNADNIGHFGLALEQYAHFTSPIRRYPDLTLHRGIKYLLAKEQGVKRKTTDSGGYHYSFDEMDLLGDHCSMTERRADDATREVADWLKSEYMQDHVGNEFNGVISSVTGFGLFVRLDDLFIDGLVHISTLENDYYQFDATRQRLIGENSGMQYRLGDKVRIRVEAVHLEQKMIDFSLIGSERKPRRAGKTAKEREKKIFKELPPKATKKRKSAVKNTKVFQKKTKRK
ncbi:ribonuclease R [Rodentibacter pneumotropicus]|uniref:ribonuclease R n=1 Tax=Rodentibacter pneumotropicus TaxID=758 RepID=UPI00098959A5|nr:ribonuclease R [Rodentibacter pneumotropicus]NBH75172.1 ribonuclease R [Rodentibacter pneumotropicus]OOF60637.1 ribonuclease R [Rodentibacter pneumotropicus]THA00506.1 ribonuclease R [Rodentibacter pneumotropicus]THA03777.1 ribonuclease R [Rodentibacter pneumotropicus]THA11216.1 ribonuclease R [Rodentibacter pneumotropicus]